METCTHPHTPLSSCPLSVWTPTIGERMIEIVKHKCTVSCVCVWYVHC